MFENIMPHIRAERKRGVNSEYQFQKKEITKLQSDYTRTVERIKSARALLIDRSMTKQA